MTRTGIDAGRLLVIGAACRDILHSALGHDYAVRATLDTDLGVAVDDWSTWEAIAGAFRRIGTNGIRFSIASRPVDVVPFGAIESPTGIAWPTERGTPLVVFGFTEVFRSALRLDLPSGCRTRIPTPAGYAVLKMRAWIDRAEFGHTTDASDLAVAAFWYQQSAAITERLWESEEGPAVLEAADWDIGLAAVRLLGEDIRHLLSQQSYSDLITRWAAYDSEEIARAFTLPDSFRVRRTLADRIEMLRHLQLV